MLAEHRRGQIREVTFEMLTKGKDLAENINTDLTAVLLGRDVKEQNSFSNIFEFVPEGVEAMVPYKGSVAEIIYQLIGGLRSGMSYCGTRTINELKKNSEFIRITSSGLRDSHAHDVNLV